VDNKKELKEKELGKVVGGSHGKNGWYYFDEYFTGFVDMYHLEEGHEYYFVRDMVRDTDGNILEGTIWFKGRVLDSWEDGGRYTKRKHKVEISVSCDRPHCAGEIAEIYGDDYAAYTTKLRY